LRYGGLTIAYRCAPLEHEDRDPRPRSVELADVRWFPAGEAMTRVTGFERSMIAKALLTLSEQRPDRP
jgi:hypothetical protein